MKTNEQLKEIYTTRCIIGFIALAFISIAMISYAGGRDMNEIAQQATQPSFYDQMVLENKLPPKTVFAEIEQAQAGIEAVKIDEKEKVVRNVLSTTIE